MIHRYDTPEALGRAAADLFVQLAREAVAARGRFSVALSGGGTPKRAYQLLAQPPWRDRVPWADVHVFWGDERCVGPEDDRSNARMARQSLLDHVPVAADQVHPIRCEGHPKAGAVDCEALLRKDLSPPDKALDLVLLGLGDNGHTASLFPHSPVLAEKERWVVAAYVEEQKMFRVTMTPIVINAARVVAFLVTGQEKARILKAVIEGPRDPVKLPAQLIKPSPGRMIWMVDKAAATLLAQ